MSLVIIPSQKVNLSLYKTSTITPEQLSKKINETDIKEIVKQLALNECKRREGERLIKESKELKIVAQQAFAESKEFESESKEHTSSALQARVAAEKFTVLGLQQIASGQQNLLAAQQKIASGLEGIASGQQKIASGQQKIASGQEKIASGQQKIASGQEKIASGLQGIASGQQKIELGLEIRQEAQAKKRKIIAEMFYATFQKKTDLIMDQVEELHSSYISGAITYQAKQENNQSSYAQIESMKPFTKYLENHKDIKMCNFKHFKQHVSDAGTLADYLAQGNCSVTSVWFSRDISDESKVTFAEAVNKRNGALKVQYSEK